MLNSSKAGDLVADLFAGSGSTLIACEKNARRCCAMELDPKYADCIVQRWQSFSGKIAVLESTGQSFQGVKETRQGRHLGIEDDGPKKVELRQEVHV